jgi:hypothetical protein
MLNVGDLVNNIDCLDYNFGMVLETHVNITRELLEAGALLEISYAARDDDIQVEPPGSRVLWSCGDISVHYNDELEVISAKSQQLV